MPKYKESVRAHFSSFTCRPGGRDCFSFSAFSCNHSVRREQRNLKLSNLVGDLEGVEEARAADLELDIVSVLLYLDALGILPPRLQEEILDLLDLTWHGGTSETRLRFKARSCYSYYSGTKREITNHLIS